MQNVLPTTAFFTINATDPYSEARTGLVRTSHGSIATPMFMPVGTLGTVKALAPHELCDAGVEIMLTNTYHLHLRPGDELIKRCGGLHHFINWDKPLLADSGGYQVFSLAGLNKIEDDGVYFQSHWDGSSHYFTPEKVINIQHNLGVDILMCFDDCPPYPCTYDHAQKSLARTHRWAERCLEAHRKKEPSNNSHLFGIVQGSTFDDLRQYSAQFLMEREFAGYAIGGLSVGEPKDSMYSAISVTTGIVPRNKPRYVMGIGTPEDLVECVGLGIDMFDCVIPSRNGRNGTVYTRKGKFIIKGAAYKEDTGSIEDGCECYTCRHFSRAYIRHLFQTGEMLASRLATLHNISFFMCLMEDIRSAIEDASYSAWKNDFLSQYMGNELVSSAD